MGKARKYLSIAGVAFALSLSSCSSDEETVITTGDNELVRITSTVRSRADQDYQASALNTSTKVGVFATSGASPILNGDNNEHTVASNGDLTTANAMHYPKGNDSKINIYAYAPYADGVDLSGSYDFSVATDQSTTAGYLQSDLVYASKENVAKTPTAVALAFDHKLSQLQVNIENEAGANLSGSSVKIVGTKTTASFTPATGIVGAASGSASDITAIANLGTGLQAYAIIIPQTIAAGTELVKIEVGGETYSAKLEQDVTFEGGKAYRFTVKLEEDLVGLKLGSTSINGWGSPIDLGTSNLEEENAENNVSEGDNNTTEDPTPDPEPGTEPDQDRIYAKFGTPEINGSYNSETNVYTWTSYENNQMLCFSFENGELANYNTFNFTFSENKKGRDLYRIQICLHFNDGEKAIVFSTDNANTYNMDMRTSGGMWDYNALKSHTLADVVGIYFQSEADKGFCTIKAEDMYISK